MPDLLLDGLPVIDLLELTASTSAVAALTQRDQSSVSRIYRQASNRLGLAFGKDHSGRYRAAANRELLQDLRRSSQTLRLRDGSQLRWIVSPWQQGIAALPGYAAEELAPALTLPWCGARRTCELLREHVLDLAVLPGFELLSPEQRDRATAGPIPLACGQLLALPLLRHPLAIAAATDHPLHRHGPLQPADLAGWPLQQAWSEPAPQLEAQLHTLGLRLSASEEVHARAALTLLPALGLTLRPNLKPLPLEPSLGLAELDLIVLQSALLDKAPLQRLIPALRSASQDCHGHRQDLSWAEASP